jgi:hypothetical protein
MDITIIYITMNLMSQKWVDFQNHNLLKAADSAPIISISRLPMNLGTNLIDTGTPGYWNLYSQLLRAAKKAKTPYVALAEDDVLYTRAHFHEFRPGLDCVAYDRSRWSLFTWEKEPFYCLRQRISNCSLIASRDYLVAALEERQARHPNGCNEKLLGEVGRSKVDARLGVSKRNMVEFYSYGPIVQLNHPQGHDLTQKTQWKRHGQIRAWSIPYWGPAKEILSYYA